MQSSYQAALVQSYLLWVLLTASLCIFRWTEGSKFSLGKFPEMPKLDNLAIGLFKPSFVPKGKYKALEMALCKGHSGSRVHILENKCS